MHKRIASILVGVALSAVLVLNAFSGAARFYLDSLGVGFLIYIPSALMFVVIVILIARQVNSGVLEIKDFVLLFLLALSFLTGYVQVGNFLQVSLGVYVLLPFLFGFFGSRVIEAETTFLRKLMISIWLFSVLGLAIDEYIDVPWRGFEYKLGDFQIEGNRDWETFGIRRLSGFSRASFDVAAILLVSSLFVMFSWKSTLLRALVWLITAYAIVLTTSKGILVSMVVLSLSYLAYSLGLKRIVAWGGLAVAVILIAMPLGAWLYIGDSATVNLEGDILLQSLGDRFVQMWPEAFQNTHSVGNPLWGAGLGSIGVPLDHFGGGVRNAADNVFVYLYSLIGVSAALWIAYVAVRAKSYLLRAEGEIDSEFLFFQIFIGTLTYGVTTNVLESTVLGLMFGFTVGVIVSSHQGVSKVLVDRRVSVSRD